MNYRKKKELLSLLRQYKISKRLKQTPTSTQQKMADVMPKAFEKYRIRKYKETSYKGKVFYELPNFTGIGLGSSKPNMFTIYHDKSPIFTTGKIKDLMDKLSMII